MPRELNQSTEIFVDDIVELKESEQRGKFKNVMIIIKVVDQNNFIGSKGENEDSFEFKRSEITKIISDYNTNNQTKDLQAYINKKAA